MTALQRYLWIAVAGAMVIAYALDPLWPRVVRPLPWRWWAIPAFVAVTLFLCFKASTLRRDLWRALVLSIGLAAYFFAEGTIFSIAYYLISGKHNCGLVCFAFTGVVTLLSQLIAVLIFVLFCVWQLVSSQFLNSAASSDD
jgi:hypothetical protein